MVSVPGYRQNSAIRADDYNTFRAAVDRVYGVGYRDSGYGQTAIAIPYLVPNQAIWNTEWRTLRNAVEVVMRHQDGSVAAMLPTAQSNAAVRADQTLPPTSSSHDLVGAVSRIEARKLDWFAAGGGGTEPWTSSYGAAWSSTAVLSFELHFASNDEARYWFNTGNSLSIRPEFIPADGSGQSHSWAAFLGNLPILYVNVGAVHDSNLVPHHPGYYSLPVAPAAPALIYSATYTGSGTAGGRNLADFSGNRYEVHCRVLNDNPGDPNGGPGRIFQFTVRFFDVFTATQVGDNDLVNGTLRLRIGYAWTLLVQLTPVGLNPDGTQPKLYVRPPLGLTSESGSSGPADDITPDYFAFTDIIGVEPDTLIYSNILTVTGINTASPIQVDNAEMNINGTGWVTSGRINNGQTLQLRIVSHNFSTGRVHATIRMTGYISVWTVETKYFIRFVDFRTPGNYTWAVPNNARLATLEVVGGGGGGGSASEDHYFGNNFTGGGGGGGSGGRHSVQVAVIPGEILSITVGAGGLGSKTQSQPGNGGNSTTVSGSFGSYTATGGGGGQKGDVNPAPPKGGAGGIPNGNAGGNALVNWWIGLGGVGAASPSPYGTGQQTPIAGNGILGAGGGGSTGHNRNFGNFPAGDGGHGLVRIDY